MDSNDSTRRRAQQWWDRPATTRVPRAAIGNAVSPRKDLAPEGAASRTDRGWRGPQRNSAHRFDGRDRFRDSVRTGVGLGLAYWLGRKHGHHDHHAFFDHRHHRHHYYLGAYVHTLWPSYAFSGYGYDSYGYGPSFYSFYRYRPYPWYGSYATVIYDYPEREVHYYYGSDRPGGGADVRDLPAYSGSAAGGDADLAVLREIELGSVAFKEGRYDQAQQHYLAAVLADPDDGYGKILYGLASFALGQFGEAAFAVRDGLETTPRLMAAPIDVRGLYADAAAFNDHLGRLAGHVNSVNRTAPSLEDRDVRLLLTYLYHAAGDAEAARITVTDLVARYPVDEPALALRDAVITR